MISKKVEEKLLLPFVTRTIDMQLPGVRTMVDTGEPTIRDCDWFELFFAIDPNCGIEIDPETADGAEALYELGKSAAELIIERYAEKSESALNKISCIGVCLQSDWSFGREEIPELEAMIGTVHKENGLVGCWRFAVRFAPAPYQIEGRCLSAEPKADFDEQTYNPYI